MSTKEIIKLGDPIIRKACLQVEDFSMLSSIIDDMFDAMYESEGIGLAANQVNLDMNLFILHVPGEDENDDGEPRIFVNSKIIATEGESKDSEGCLSIPGVRLEITRPETITLEYQDMDRNSHVEKFSGLTARAIQHETDHLIGVLITDKVSQVQKLQYKQDLKEIERQAKVRYSERQSGGD